MWIAIGIIAAIICGSTALGITAGVKKKWLNQALNKSQKIKKIDDLNRRIGFKSPKNTFVYRDFFPELKKYKNNTIDKTISKFRNDNYSSILASLTDIKENANLLSQYKKEVESILNEPSVIVSDHKINENKYKAEEKLRITSKIKKPITKVSFDIWFEYVSPQGRSKWESDHYRKTISDVDEPSAVIDRNFPVYQEPVRHTNGYMYGSPYYHGGAYDKPDILSMPISSISTNQLGHQNSETLAKLKEKKNDDFKIKVSFRINYLGKIIFTKFILDNLTNSEITERRFELLSSKKLLSKYNELFTFLDRFEYLETGQQIYDLAAEIQNFYSDDSHFEVDLSDILSKDPDDIIKTVKISFAFDPSGDLYICNARIGTVENIDAYFEENPKSRFKAFFDETARDLNTINRDFPLNSKLSELKRKFLSNSTRFVVFEYVDLSMINLFIDFKEDGLGYARPIYEVQFSIGGEEIQLAKYRCITLDTKPYRIYGEIKKELDELANRHALKRNKLLKLLAVCADDYRYVGLNEYLKKRIQITFSKSLLESDEWYEYFNFEPETPPLDLNELKDGSLVLSETLTGVMRDYQKYAFSWMSKLEANNLSGILADDMGLGKTLETISLIESNKTELPNLIICPLSLTHNWAKEFNKWTPNEKVKVITSRNISFLESFSGNKKVNIIVSYAFAIYHLDLFRSLEFNYIILDEAQYIKNAETRRSEGVKKLKSKTRFALTGTPIENKEEDLWSIFEFLCPQLFAEYKIKSLSAENKRKYIKPFILRRRKKDVLKELPEKNEIDVLIDMDDDQRGIYERYSVTGTDFKDDPMWIFALLTRLRQICVIPALVDKDAPTTSSKMSEMLKIVDNIIQNDESVLIYSFFASVFDYLTKELEVLGIKYCLLTGNTPREERVGIIDSFDNDPNIKVFLLSLKAGGVGLNLTKANNVIFLDPWWNVAVENQAADRVHRIGQTKKVNVYRLICADSIEQKVIEKQKEKMEIINYFIEDENQLPISKLSLKEIKELLSIDANGE